MGQIYIIALNVEKHLIGEIKDEDIQNMAYHMKAITEILKKYKEK